MPFTLSHVAVVLPFRKMALVWSALVVGSVAPDLPYLIGTTEYRSLGHQWPGNVIFTLPASMVALWIFHNVIRKPAVQLLPRGFQLRVPKLTGRFEFGDEARFAMISLSLALGIATHLLWDAFTHPLHWHGRRVSWLDALVKLPHGSSAPRFMVFQYASSILGLVILAIWLVFWFRNTAPADDGNAPVRSRWFLAVCMFALAVVIALLRARWATAVPTGLERRDEFMLVAGVTGMAVFFWQVFLYCVMVSTHQVWIIT